MNKDDDGDVVVLIQSMTAPLGDIGSLIFIPISWCQKSCFSFFLQVVAELINVLVQIPLIYKEENGWLFAQRANTSSALIHAVN